MAQKLSSLPSEPSTLIDTSCFEVITRSVFHVPAARIPLSSCSSLSLTAAYPLPCLTKDWHSAARKLFDSANIDCEAPANLIKEPFNLDLSYKEGKSNYGLQACL